MKIPLQELLAQQTQAYETVLNQTCQKAELTIAAGPSRLSRAPKRLHYPSEISYQGLRRWTKGTVRSSHHPASWMSDVSSRYCWGTVVIVPLQNKAVRYLFPIMCAKTLRQCLPQENTGVTPEINCLTCLQMRMRCLIHLTIKKPYGNSEG